MGSDALLLHAVARALGRVRKVLGHIASLNGRMDQHTLLIRTSALARRRAGSRESDRGHSNPTEHSTVTTPLPSQFFSDSPVALLLNFGGKRWAFEARGPEPQSSFPALADQGSNSRGSSA